MQEEFKVGDIVKGAYKSGTYAGEVTAIRPQHYLIKVLNVLKHPVQGDLHHPKSIDVPIFHQRRALANGEHVNIMKPAVHPFEGELMRYDESLRKALSAQIEKLQQDDSEWAKRSLRELEELEQDYFKNKQK